MKRRPSRTAFAAAAVLSAVAVFSPQFDALCDRSFAWHMVQHLVLLFIVPLCVLLADPFHAVLNIAGKRRTAAIVRVTEPLRTLASPAVALVLFIATLWVTHFSPLYEASMQSETAHVFEHMLYFFAGTVFWLPVIAPPPVRPPAFPVRLLYLLLAMPQGALVATAIDSARSPLYPHYAAALGTAGAMADQSNAAAVMWICGGMTVFVALLITAAVWARRERRPFAV